MKIYSLLKYSYNKSNKQCFMPGMFLHQGDEEKILTMLKRHLEMTNVDSVTMCTDSTGDIINITYKDEYEKDFYHGLRIMVLDTDNSSSYPVTKDSLPDLVTKVEELVNEHNSTNSSDVKVVED